MLQYVLMVLLIISVLGYFSYFKIKWDMNIFLAPVFIITSISFIMYLSGLLNIMPLTVYFLLVCGICLCLRYVKKVKWKELIKDNFFPLAICMVFFAYLIYYYQGARYRDGDTMTHWGIIVRSMFENDRLPNFKNAAVIAYQSYPPAAACWIYFVQKLIGYGEARALFAQSSWLICCGISLFSMNKRRHKAGDLLIGITFVYYLKSLDQLHVDYILGALVIACVAGIIYFSNDVKKLLYYTLPFIGVIPVVKNSGVLFTMYIAIILFWLLRYKQNSFKASLGYAAALFGVAVSSIYLWQAHIKMVYNGGNTTRHSISFSYLSSIAKHRSKEDVWLIINNFFVKWFSMNGSLC